MKRKTWMGISFLVALLLVGGLTASAWASFQIPQTPLDGAILDKYVTPLPYFAGARVKAGTSLAVSYSEFQQKVLPDNFYAGLPNSITPYSGPGPAITFNPQKGTFVWGYKVGDKPALFPGYTVEVQRGTGTTVTYTNTLGTATSFPILQRYLTVDQTIHWANPLGLLMNNPARFAPYSGPQPVVVHLHGGELRSDSDGGPDEWWTPGGEGFLSTPPAPGGIRGPNYFKNVYTYPNTQDATTLWFHEHPLGVTRLNVYAGLAAFYFIRDEFDTGIAGTGLDLPAGPQEAEIVIQDRQFDTDGQFLFPDGYPAGLNGPPPNPDVHPFWNPEFFGDVIVVNGRSWPFFEVQPRRYRLRLLDGSNARFYEMHLENLEATPNPTPGPPIYVIGTDGGLLDKPVETSSTATNNLLIAPGERYDVIIDFAGFEGQNLTILNTANGPYPGGDPPDPATTGQLMQFKVNQPFTGPDNSFNPATPGTTIRGGAGQPPAIVPFTNGLGEIDPQVTVNRKRQLVLREVEGPGGPEEVLVNNTKWNGLRTGTLDPVPGSARRGVNWLTELPQVGSTEEWEIINITADAHPIHLHLIQFQLLNRQVIDDVAYTTVYEGHFPTGVAIDGYGPPLPYNKPNSDGALGGNPSVSPFLIGAVIPPLPQEVGWKDTVIMYPGQVTRIIGRWAPQDVPVDGVKPGQNLFAFDPTYGLGYVWHCHILDHEDNEMMRPYIPTKNADNTYATYGSIESSLYLILLVEP